MGHTTSFLYDTFIARRQAPAPRSNASSSSSSRNYEFSSGYIYQDPSGVLQSHHTRVQLKCSDKTIKPGQRPQTFPCLVSLKSDDDEPMDGKMIRYVELDLICVIDVSGSMSGPKIELVKESLLYVIDQLSERDRMALVTFADQGNVLQELTGDLGRLRSKVKELAASGSTNMRAGLELAYDMVRKSKSENIKSVWVLSDGCDTTGFKGVHGMAQEHIQGYLKKPNEFNFTIHTLGYGRDHDSKLMKNIAELKSGKFLFVQQQADLSKGIANLLGGMLASIAHKVTLQIECRGTGPLAGARIVKSFSPSVIHNKKEDTYTVTIQQYRAGSTNSYVFEVELPIANKYIPDDQYKTLHRLLTVKANYLSLDNKKTQSFDNLEVTVLHPSDILKKEHPDAEVMENYCRVRVVQLLRESTELMERNSHVEATQKLKEAKEIIRMAPPSDKIAQLQGDIDEMLKRLQGKDFRGAYQFTMGQERYHGECYYSTGQERFQSIRVRQMMPGMEQFKDREWYQ